MMLLATPISRTQKLKLMRQGGQLNISLIVQHSPSRATPVGHKYGIGVGCNLF
jgi:hypothetical protein